MEQLMGDQRPLTLHVFFFGVAVESVRLPQHKYDDNGPQVDNNQTGAPLVERDGSGEWRHSSVYAPVSIELGTSLADHNLSSP